MRQQVLTVCHDNPRELGLGGAWGAHQLAAWWIGGLLGFVAGFPMAFALAAWATFDRVFQLWWMLELWVGAVFATLVAGACYRER